MAAQSKPAAASKQAAARAENGSAPKTLEFEGLKLTLPAKMPFRVLRHAREDGIAAAVGVLESLLGPEQIEQVWELDIDVERGEELVDLVLAEYGLSLGE